jgi:hypothetical protein
VLYAIFVKSERECRKVFRLTIENKRVNHNKDKEETMKTLIQVIGFAILYNFILPISFLLIFGFDYNKRFLEAYHGAPSLTSKILGVCIIF